MSYTTNWKPLIEWSYTTCQSHAFENIWFKLQSLVAHCFGDDNFLMKSHIQLCTTSYDGMTILNLFRVNSNSKWHYDCPNTFKYIPNNTILKHQNKHSFELCNHKVKS